MSWKNRSPRTGKKKCASPVRGGIFASRRGAIALEYILLAAFFAIALMGAFVYFRQTMKAGVGDMTRAGAMETAGSVKKAKALYGE